MGPWDLEPGARYRVARTFRDFDGTVWREGLELVFERHTYFPYDGGHTFHVALADGARTAIRLSDAIGTAEERAVLDALERFLERVA